MKSASFSATILEKRAAESASSPPLDADTERARAWVRRGKPQGEIAYDNAVPKQSDAELARFRRTSYRRQKG